MRRATLGQRDRCAVTREGSSALPFRSALGIARHSQRFDVGTHDARVHTIMRSFIRASSPVFLSASLAGSIAIVLGLEARADACSPPRHRTTLVAPGTGESLPASAPGILVSGEDGVEVQLFDAGGASVAGALKVDGYRKYFAPSSPLAVGSYTVRYQSYAPDTGPAPSVLENAITVTAAVPLPTRTGTLSVAGTDRATRSVWTSSGSCVEDADVAMVRLALTPDVGLAPYASVVAWETKVDGEYWSQAQGTLPATDGVRTVLNLFTACDAGGTDGRDNGLASGVHDVQVMPILVGSSATIAPATLRVTVSCDADNGTIDPRMVSADPSAPPAKSADRDENDATTPVSDGDGSSSSTSGCTAAPAREGSFGLVSLVGVALAAASIRRRRRR